MAADKEAIDDPPGCRCAGMGSRARAEATRRGLTGFSGSRWRASRPGPRNAESSGGKGCPRAGISVKNEPQSLIAGGSGLPVAQALVPAAARLVSAFRPNGENFVRPSPTNLHARFRRHLPHRYPEGKWLFVTWHLHGSLPPGNVSTVREALLGCGVRLDGSIPRLSARRAHGIWLRSQSPASLWHPFSAACC